MQSLVLLAVSYMDVTAIEQVFYELTPLRNCSPLELTRWVVVGNGPLTAEERFSIRNMSQHGSLVLRFNDENSFRIGDPTDVHVIRHPSWSGRTNGVVEWHVAPFEEWIPPNAVAKTLVYERQYAATSSVRPSQRLFPSTCNSTYKCYVNETIFGASTGGVVLSALSEEPMVSTVDVFGMNWMGSVDHVDFLHPKMVENSCRKCTIHRTHERTYGQSGTITALVVLGGILLVGFFVFGFIIDLEATAMWKFLSQ